MGGICQLRFVFVSSLLIILGGYSANVQATEGSVGEVCPPGAKLPAPIADDDGTETSIALLNLAEDCLAAGRIEEAETFKAAGLAAFDIVPRRYRPPVLISVRNLASAYTSIGRFGDAEPLLLLAKRVGEEVEGVANRHTMVAYTELGKLYEQQGRYEEAETLAAQAAGQLERSEGATFFLTVAARLNLADVYQTRKRYHDAQEVLERLIRDIESSQLPSDELTFAGAADGRLRLVRWRLANIMAKAGQAAQAETVLIATLAALTAARKKSDAFELRDLNELVNADLADVLSDQGQFDRAERLYLGALAHHLGKPYVDGQRLLPIYLGLARLDQKRGKDPRKAIFFLGQSVNIIQDMRHNMRDLDAPTQQTFLQKWLATYADLQGLLIGLGRLSEAELVGRMIKDTEYQVFVRGTELTELGEKVALSRQEQDWQAQLADWAQRPSQLAGQMTVLRQRESERRLNDLERRKLNDLQAAYDTAYSNFRDQIGKWSANLRTIDDGIAQDEARALEVASSERRQAEVSEIGPDVALLQVVALPDALHLFLITPDAFKHVAVPVQREEVFAGIYATRKAINRVRADLSVLGEPLHTDDVRAQLGQLYRWLVAPIEQDLADAGTRTLMLNLQGKLRYIPFAALWDGKGWLTERFRLAIYTPAVHTQFVRPENVGEGAAFGLTRATPGFSALPGVRQELAAIMGSDGRPGVLEGPPFLTDEDFNRTALEKALAMPAPVLHIASHFKLAPGDQSGSFLVLGDGSHLSLAEINLSSRFRFRGIELLTLSACETGLGGDGTGMEIEGFGALAQNKGAASVMATLWPVADQGVPYFMEEFYRAMTAEGLDKAAAIQAAQIKMIRSPDLSDPFFWAPFVLMGNWR